MTEETLGRRIAANRKRLGLTQDALAEQLGVTAQAVSKWENDQSCPDISMLPKLAQIFAVTTDELLGVEKKAEEELPQLPAQETSPEPMKVSAVSRTGIGTAVWLLLTGAVLFASEVSPVVPIPVWKAVCLCGLLVFGLFGLYPQFSLFRLGCAVMGGYCLYCDLFTPRVQLNEELLFPVLLLFFGAGLLLDCILGKKRPIGYLSISGVGETSMRAIPSGAPPTLEKTTVSSASGNWTGAGQRWHSVNCLWICTNVSSSIPAAGSN